MKVYSFLPVVLGFSSFDYELGRDQLCQLNYNACIKGDNSFGANCKEHTELGQMLLCTVECDVYFERQSLEGTGVARSLTRKLND